MTLHKLSFPAREGDALNTTRSDHAERYAATRGRTAGHSQHQLPLAEHV